MIKECTDVKIWKSGSVPYFCGENESCFDPTEEGYKLALDNLINFPFIGLTSDFDDSVRILEKMFPHYFDSLSHSFDQVQQFARESTSTGHKEQQEKATNETITKIAERMPFELKLYEIIKKRYKQLKSYYLFDGPVPDFLLESMKHLNLSSSIYWKNAQFSFFLRRFNKIDPIFQQMII